MTEWMTIENQNIIIHHLNNTLNKQFIIFQREVLFIHKTLTLNADDDDEEKQNIKMMMRGRRRGW